MNDARDKENSVAAACGELVTYHQKKSQSFCDTYIFEPESTKEKLCGRLFLLIEIEENSPKAAEVAEAIATIAQHEYYKNEKPGLAANFEAALAKVNDVLAEIAQHGEIAWVGKINAIIAAHYQNQFMLSQTGRARSFLIRGGEPMEIAEEDTSEKSPTRTFDTIANGEVMPHDHVVLTTAHLLNNVAIQKIEALLQDNPVMTASRLIEDSAEKNAEQPICSIFLKIDTEKAIEIEDAKDKKYADLTTDEIYAASPTKQVQNWYDNARSRTPVVKAARAGSKAVNGIKVSGLFVGHLASNVVTGIKEAQAKRRSIKEEEKAIEEELGTSAPTKRASSITSQVRASKKKGAGAVWASSFDKIKNLPDTFRRMPKPSQMLLVTSGSLLIVFIVSIGIFSTKRSSDAEVAAAESKLDTASEKISSASASLIYNDISSALSYLDEASQINQEVLGTSHLNEEARLLQEQIDAERERIAHINDVKDIETLGDLGSANGVRAVGLFVDGATIYVGRADNNKIYRIDSANQTVKETTATSKNLGSFNIAAPFYSDDQVIFVTDQNELASYDLDQNTIAELDTSLTGKAVDIATYGNSNLYALVPAANQIFKFSQSFGGFGQGARWISASAAQLADTVSLAVDGNIYVLHSSGVIDRFLQGQRDDFSITGLETPLKNPTKIFTNEKNTHLYVLDPENSRVVVLRKNGSFVKEMTSPEFLNISDIYVDENRALVFALAGAKILRFPLELE